MYELIMIVGQVGCLIKRVCYNNDTDVAKGI